MGKPSKKDAPWRLDWAGRHGTAWGTANACLTTVTATTAAHSLGSLPGWLGGPIDVPPAVAIGAGVLGVVGSFGKAALSTVKTPVATVVYQATCWSGIGAWSAWMLSQSEWTFSSWLVGTGVLGGGAITAGILASLGGQEREGGEGTASAAPSEIWNQDQRNQVAKALTERILYLGGSEAQVKVKAVEPWTNGFGYSAQGIFLNAKWTMEELTRLCSRLADELNLEEGCTIEAYRPEGGKRRDWVLDVCTKNGLAREQRYPVPREPLTVNGPLPLGARARGDVDSLRIRSRNVLLIGEPGSGKTNTLHVVTAGVVSCADAIALPIDLTGAGYPRPWVMPWLKGETDRPALGIVADAADKAEALCRALLRAGYMRKEHYADLMIEHNDDKLPIGAIIQDEDGEEYVLPQLVLIADEIAAITGHSSQYPELKALIKQIMQELRASGIRVILAGLRSTNDVITQDMEALCQTIIGMRMKDKAESGNTFGHQYAIDPADTPYEGSAQVRHASGEAPHVIRTFRMEPAEIRKVAVAATKEETGWAPDLDPITRMAMNGRYPDGTPMPVGPYMCKEDLDWWERRWEGWSLDKKSAPEVALPTPAVIPPPPSLTQMKAAATELLERAEATPREEVDEADKILSTVDWSVLENWGAKPRTWSDRVKELLEGAWPQGMSPDELLADPEVSVSRPHLQAWLKKSVERGEIAKLGRGSYAIPPGGEMAA